MRIVLCLLASSLLTAQEVPPNPAFGAFGVRNAASFEFTIGARDRGPAPGMMIVVQGAWLGPEELVLASAPYPTSLSDAQLEIRSSTSGEVFLVPLIHAWAFQLAGVLPLDIPLGPAEITAVYEGRRSTALETEIHEAWPALFSVGQTGAGPAVAQNWESPESAPLNRFTNPARPGQTIVLWGTGLNNADGSREVTVTVGDGPAVTPFYAGPAPGLPGVDQINLTLPTEGLPEGCLLRVSVSVGNVGYSRSTIAVADGDGPCVHPGGLSESDLRVLDEGGRIPAVTLILRDQEYPPLGTFPMRRSSVAQAETLLVAADGLDSLMVRSETPFANALFSCGSSGVGVGILIRGDFGPAVQPPPPDRYPIEPAEAGDSLELRGPNGRLLTLIRPEPVDNPAPPPTSYFVQDPLEPAMFEPGDWVLRAPGGEDMMAFEVPMRVPPVPDITPPTRIERDEDVVILWDGSQFQSDDRISVQIGVPYQREDGGFTSDSVFCSAQGSLGGFRIAKENIDRLRTPDDGMADFSFSVDSASVLESPAFVYGRGTYAARRTFRVPFE